MRTMAKLGATLAAWDQRILAMLAVLAGPIEPVKPAHVARHRAMGLSTAQLALKAQARWRS